MDRLDEEMDKLVLDSNTTAEVFLNKFEDNIRQQSLLEETYSQLALYRMFFRRIKDENFVSLVLTLKFYIDEGRITDISKYYT